MSKRFKSVAIAGITFQAGSPAVDSATIISALVYQLSGSSMRYYIVGAFGRACMMALLAALLLLGEDLPRGLLTTLVMLLWVAYAFISGIVAVPYNDIVARAVPSNQRSRLMATRFFGGGVLALVVVALADHMSASLAFPTSYGVIIAMAAVLMFASSFVFTAMGEPAATGTAAAKPSFFQYLREGVQVFKHDHTFRRFVYAQWCGGAVLMAMPFYVVQASAAGFDLGRVALLLGAQTIGALASNLLWGWWGDALGKVSLLKAIAIGRIFPPLAVIALSLLGSGEAVYFVIFFASGALANGLTIAVIGFLMEISPEGQRPAYSGYFNAITAPAFLLPLLAGVLAAWFGLITVFVLSAMAAMAQALILQRVSRDLAH